MVNSGNVHFSSNLISFVRICCRIFKFWPLDSNATRERLLLSYVTYSIYCLTFYGTLAIMNGLDCCFTSVADVVESSVEMIYMLETLFNFVYYQKRASKFQVLIANMERFFETSNPRDKSVRLHYLTVVCSVLIAISIMDSLLFIFAPLFTESKTTPLNTVYFMIPRKEYWGRCVTYVLNMLHIVIAISVLMLDLLLILIIWHAACKFSLIGCALENINERRLNAWVREHQNAISYVNKINHVIGPLAVKSTIAVALYVIISGLVVTHNLPFFQLMKFFIVTAFSLLRFLACSWAADTMTENAREIAWKIYESPWIDATPDVRTDKLMIIQRCQKPITIHAKGILPAWSLKFCGEAR